MHQLHIISLNSRTLEEEKVRTKPKKPEEGVNEKSLEASENAHNKVTKAKICGFIHPSNRFSCCSHVGPIWIRVPKPSHRRELILFFSCSLSYRSLGIHTYPSHVILPETQLQTKKQLGHHHHHHNHHHNHPNYNLYLGLSEAYGILRTKKKMIEFAAI